MLAHLGVVLVVAELPHLAAVLAAPHPHHVPGPRHHLRLRLGLLAAAQDVALILLQIFSLQY